MAVGKTKIKLNVIDFRLVGFNRLQVLLLALLSSVLALRRGPRKCKSLAFPKSSSDHGGLVQLLGGAVAGLHSMIDEHFGISVVEYMAAGAIPIAHNSAGPKMDIVLEEDGHQTGFLASDKEEYADAILEILKMPETKRLAVVAAARKRAQRFSEQKFYEDFKAAIHPIIRGSSTPS